MYESFYGFSAKPFRLRPDPHFFYGSKGHKRAMAYLDYGLSQGEGFIVITGEVGAGKTTLVRNLFNNLPSEQIVAAHIVNTHLESDDTLRSVVAAFGLPYENSSKTDLLTRLEQFLRLSDQQGRRALLVVDEAQNLKPGTVEELRMLSNFQTSDDRPLLQTFLVGQPEFRTTLHSPSMQQLRQRVIASYHLGPMDAEETQAYIEHRLATVGWKGDPAFSRPAHAAIFAHTGGIPRKVNTLCDRLLLMGYLEELHAFEEAHVTEVIKDITEEFELPPDVAAQASMEAAAQVTREVRAAEVAAERRAAEGAAASRRAADSVLDERMQKLEGSVTAMLNVLRKIISAPPGALPINHNNNE